MQKNYNQMPSKAAQGMQNMSITNQGKGDD